MTPTIEPTDDDIERVALVLFEAENGIGPLAAIWADQPKSVKNRYRYNARVAILAMDRRAEVVGEPIAWRWQFGDSPWSYGSEKPSFERRVGSEGMDPDKVEPLYASPPAPAVAVPEGYWLAPLKVTPAMMEAGTKARWASAVRDADNVREIFNAMRATAPEPPAIEG